MSRKAPPSRFHRQPREEEPPFGYADLPVHFDGEIRPDGSFVPHSSPHAASMLLRPWDSHPRLQAARTALEGSETFECGWRVATYEDLPWDLHNALAAAHPYPCPGCALGQRTLL